MPTETLHDWNLEPTEAIALQKRLATRIEREDRLAAVRHIAGVDIGFEQGGEVTRAAVVVLAWPGESLARFAGDPLSGVQIAEEVVHGGPTRIPYIPGFLAFPETPRCMAPSAKPT